MPTRESLLVWELSEADWRERKSSRTQPGFLQAVEIFHILMIEFDSAKYDFIREVQHSKQSAA